MRVAFIIGHKLKSEGAVNYKGTHECAFHTYEVAPYLKEFAPTGLMVKIFDKNNDTTASVAKKVAEWGADLCIELHYNWADSAPKTQFEILAPKESTKSCEYAKKLAKKMNEKKPELTLRRDGGLHAVTEDDRGGWNVLSVIRAGVAIALLIEPCFGNTRSPASEFVIGNPKLYAKTLIDSIYELFKEDSINEDVPAQATLQGLVSAYKKHQIPYPDLKAITLAQWLLETGRVKSELARKHYNFGGIKYRSNVPDLPKDCYKVEYTANDGKAEYFGCPTYTIFFELYWKFLQRPVYKGFDKFKNDPEGFIRFIASAGYCPEPDYADKVLKLLPEAKKLLGEV